MPEDLWKAAVEAAQVHGVNPVARAVRLDYYSLKRRVEKASREVVSSQAFIEVTSCPIPVEPAGGCVVEMERPDGAWMRVVQAEGDVVVRLVEEFWRSSRG